MIEDQRIFEGVDETIESRPKPRLVLRPLMAIEAKPVFWIWRSRLACGEPAFLAGVPGVGKSFISGAIAASVSRGRQLPGGGDLDGPADVIVLALEDDAGRVLRPRYEGLGADLNRIHVLEGVSTGDDERIRPFSLRHIELLERALDARPNVRLIIIDPIASLLGSADMGKSNEVRELLDPFLDQTCARDVAVLFNAHVNKSQVGALNRVEGSLGGFVGRARTVLAAGRDEELGKRGVGLLKSNLGPTDVPTIEYEIDAMGRFLWAGENREMVATRLFEAADSREERSVARSIREVLLEALQGGPRPARDLERYLLSECGFAKRSIERERAKLAQDGLIRSERHGFGASVTWSLVTKREADEASIVRPYSALSAIHPHTAEYTDNGRTMEGEVL